VFSVVAVVGLAGCLGTPARTDQIDLVGTRTVDGWTYDYYRNRSYPCAIRGYQTFAIGTRVGSSETAAAPLWVRMHGGGVGWFGTDGTPLPTAGGKSEESFDDLLAADSRGLMARVKAAPEGFRTLIVSMCSHDIYSGNDNPDPHNPNTTPDGKPRPTTGLTATKAAIQFTQERFPTDDYVLHGTSAGGVGTFSVAWALQQQGIRPTAIVSDSGVMNQQWQLYIAEHGVPGSAGCEKATVERGAGVLGRIDPQIGDIDNQPDLLVARGALTVPVMHVWNHADSNVCGSTPIECPLHDGTSVTMGAADCNHEPLRLAIAAQGTGSTSENMAVCVEGRDAAVPCDRHVVTAGTDADNTDPDVPADYQGAILTWVRARLADD
jgi:hypothetical protein